MWSILEFFGCPCYSLFLEVKRDKLDQKKIPSVFLGYSNNAKGYKIYDVQTRKVITNRNVKFNEFGAWNWDKNVAETSQQILFEGNSPNEQDTTIIQKESSSHEEFSVRGDKSLADIYARCNVVAIEPNSFHKVINSSEQKNAMEEKLKMIAEKSSMVVGGKAKT